MSGGAGQPSSVWVGTGDTSSWRMEGAEEEDEEEGSSGKSPDIPEVDLREKKKSGSQTDEGFHSNCCVIQTVLTPTHERLHHQH